MNWFGQPYIYSYNPIWLQQFMKCLNPSVLMLEYHNQSIKKLILASLLFDRFMKDVRIGLLQINIIYEGQ